MPNKKPVLDVNVKRAEVAKSMQRRERRRIHRLPVRYDGPVQPGQRWDLRGIEWIVTHVTPEGTVTLQGRWQFWVMGDEELVRLGTQLTDSAS